MENTKHKVRHKIKIRGNEKFHVILLSVGENCNENSKKRVYGMVGN